MKEQLCVCNFFNCFRNKLFLKKNSYHAIEVI